MCSPFSLYAVDILARIGLVNWKIGSGEAIDREIIDNIRKKECDHIFISAGMLRTDEIVTLNTYMIETGLDWTLMHCTSQYPAPISKVNLGRIKEYQSKYGENIGYSDHSANINVAITAITLDINAYEGHIVFDRNQYGPDSSSSLTIKEFKRLREFRDDYMTLKNTTTKVNENDKSQKTESCSQKVYASRRVKRREQ